MIGRGKKPNRECEAAQRFSRIERSFPCCMSDSGRRRCYQSPEACAARERKLEPRWGPAQGRAGARKGGAVHREPDSTGSRERKSENSPGFSLPLAFRLLSLAYLAGEAGAATWEGRPLGPPTGHGGKGRARRELRRACAAAPSSQPGATQGDGPCLRWSGL